MNSSESNGTFIPSSIARNPLFVGRSDVLSDLESLLQQHRLVALTGIAGIGKTDVIVQFYALQHHKYDHHVFLTWNSESGSLLAWKELFCSAVDLPMAGFADETLDYRYARALAFYWQKMTGRKLLVIDALPLDYAEEVIEELSRLEADILLVCRRTVDNYFTKYQLDVMIPEESEQLFCVHTNIELDTLSESDKSLLASIVHSAGSHPLTLEMLAKVLRTEKSSLNEIVDRISHMGLIISNAPIATGWMPLEQGPLSKSFAKLIEPYDIKPESYTAKILAVYAILPALSVSSHDVISWMGWPSDVKTYWADLEAISLLKWDTEHNAYVMHPVIAEAVRSVFPLRWEEGELGDTLLQGMEVATEQADSIDASIFSEYLVSMLGWCPMETEKVALLAYRAGVLLRRASSYTEAIEWLTASTDMIAKSAGMEHPITAATFDLISDAYFALGHFEKALEWQLKSLTIIETAVGANNPSASTSYKAIARMKDNMGYYAEALEWYSKALHADEEHFGLDHPVTASTYHSIGTIYFLQKQYEVAMEFYTKALAIREMMAPNADTITTYHQIGTIYGSLGQIEKAIGWYMKAATISIEAFGTDHPNTAATYNNLAGAYFQDEQLETALEYYEKALAIREKTLDPMHPDTATTLSNIGYVYFLQDNNTSALEKYFAALAIRDKVLGADHDDTLAIYNNIAVVYEDMGDHEEALGWYNKLLSLVEASTNFDLLAQVTIYNNIATIYGDMEELTIALEWLMKALAVLEQLLGTDHLDTAETYSNIGNCYLELEDFAVALEWSRKALAIRENQLGSHAPAVADSYSDIGTIYQELENYDMALEFFLKALATRQTLFGRLHPSVASSYNDIALVYYALEDHEQAVEWYQKAMAIMEELM